MKIKYKIILIFLSVSLFIIIYSHFMFVKRITILEKQQTINNLTNKLIALNGFIESIKQNIFLLSNKREEIKDILRNNDALTNYIHKPELRKTILNYIKMNAIAPANFKMLDNTGKIILSSDLNQKNEVSNEYLELFKKDDKIFQLVDEFFFIKQKESKIFILRPLFNTSTMSFEYMFLIDIDIENLLTNSEFNFKKINGFYTNTDNIKPTVIKELDIAASKMIDCGISQKWLSKYVIIKYKYNEYSINSVIDLQEGFNDKIFSPFFIVSTIKILMPLIFLLILLTYYFNFTISNPLIKITAAIENIKHSESLKTSVNQNDEIGKLAQALEYYVKNNTLLIAEKQTMIDKLINIQTQLQSETEIKDEFFRNITHDLKTPLHSIINYAQIVKNKTKDIIDSRQSQNLYKIIYNSKFLLSLIENILNYSKLKNGSADEIAIKKFDINKTYRQIFNIIEPLIDKRYIHFKTVLKINYPLITSDEEKIRHIILNIFSNAVKFTTKGFIKLYLKTTRNKIFIIVKDSGKGIPQTKIESIFKAFYKIENEKSIKYNGTGIGLSIVKKYCDLLKAKIKLKSEINKGTTFFIIIPY